MAQEYYKKKEEKQQAPDTITWYDLIRDKWLGSRRTEVAEDITLPDTGETVTITKELE